MTVAPDALSQAEDEYEQAEAAFLMAVREDGERAILAREAKVLAAAAERWNTVAYEHFHAASGGEREALDLLTERTEVLAELWADLAAAYRSG